MNWAQRLLVILTASGVAACLLYPPWQYEVVYPQAGRSGDSTAARVRPVAAGYGLLWRSPGSADEAGQQGSGDAAGQNGAAARIDWSRLAAACLAILAVGAALTACTQTRRRLI